MLQLLHGPNIYESLRRLDQIKNKYKDQNFDICIYDLQDQQTSLSDLNFGTFGMFETKKVYIFKRIFSLPKSKLEELFCILQQSSEDIILWEDKLVDKRLKIYKQLTLNAQIEEFQQLKESDIKNWIKQYLKLKKIEFPSQFVDLLVYLYGSDQSTITNEIRKIEYILSSESRNSILEKDFEILTYTFPDEIWKFVDSFLKGNRKQALNLVDKVIAKSESEFQIIGAILSQLRALFLVNSDVSQKQIQENLKIHPFIIQKVKSLGRFQIEKIQNIYSNLVQTESDLKQGLIDAKLALTFLILNT